MNSLARGKDTLPVEVTNISSHGFWLLSNDRELFLSFDDFPWFKNQVVSDILNVEEPSLEHFYWPDLDIDLSLKSIEHPEQYPLEANADYMKR